MTTIRCELCPHAWCGVGHPPHSTGWRAYGPHGHKIWYCPECDRRMRKEAERALRKAGAQIQSLPCGEA
jgi:hypothetical protein